MYGRFVIALAVAVGLACPISASIPPPSWRSKQHSQAVLALATLQGEWVGTITEPDGRGGTSDRTIWRRVSIENLVNFVRIDTDIPYVPGQLPGATPAGQRFDTSVITFDVGEGRYELLPLNFSSGFGARDGRSELIPIKAEAISDLFPGGQPVPLASIISPELIREVRLEWSVPDAAGENGPVNLTKTIKIVVTGDDWSEIVDHQGQGQRYQPLRIKMKRVAPQPAPQ